MFIKDIFESEDDMFAQRGKADVAKISTDQLRNMYSLAMSDSRQEYASAHKLQMARISTELKRRGVSVPVRENDDMFAGSNRAADQIKQDRHPLKDYISYEQFEMLMDEFDDLKSHTTQHYEQDAYLHALKQVNGLPKELFDVIEYYMYAPTKTNAENDTKLHNDLNNAFRRTWTEYKPSTMVGFLARSMSRACLAAIREKDDVDLDESDDMFADRRGARIGNAIIDAGGVLIDDAPYRWGDDQEMVDVTVQDGEDMIKVGKTFISQGVEAGIDAMFELDTMVRDQIWDAANSVGVNLNDYINESEEDMFAPASKSTIATAAKRNVVGKVAAKGRASRKTDTELQEIVAIAEQVFGRKYSSGTIGGGKVYRISLMTRGLGGMYHYSPMASVSKNDKIILNEQKKKFFDILTSRGLDTSRVDVKYHMGAMLYTSVRIKMQLPDAVVEDKYSMLINEMFENADDEMFAPQRGGKYWGNVPPEFNRLWGDLVPDSGSASTLEGELLRSANRLYYDYFNNGFGNNVSGAENFLRNFGGGSSRLMKALNTVHPYTRGIIPERSEEPQIELALDVIFDTILYYVIAQQGNYHPNPGDMFDYSERDDPNPEDEEDDEYGWQDEEDDDEELDEAEAELDEPPAPERKTQTKTKPQFDYDPFQQKPDQPLANRQAEPKGKADDEPKGFRRASAASTRRAAGSVHPTDQMRDMLGRMRDIEIDPDLAPYPTEEPTLDVSVDVNTENLPAVAGEAIQAAGMSSPEFHQVARLPGNMSAMIRQLGKKLFGSMTSTPTEDIYMIGNLGGQGPNSRQEVNAVANFVQQNGKDMGPGDIDFNAIMPGYTAETHQFVAAGIRWLMVKDFAGQYIYAWPESDSKTPSSQAQLGNAPKRLR